jgi:flagellar biogenesis protein FliO
MARLPHLLLAFAVLMSAADVSQAEQERPAPRPLTRANQGASLTVEQPRSRMPPVRLAQHNQPYDSEPLHRESTLETAPVDDPLAKPLRLARPQSSSSAPSDSEPIDPTSSLITVGTSLAVVLGLFFVMTYFIRRNLPRGVQAPPGEVLEVLGRAPLPGKQQLQVVRFGSKLVLLSVTPEGVEAVAEITQPDEVQQITALCRRESQGSSAHAFQEILSQMGREPARGFVEQRPARTSPGPARA